MICESNRVEIKKGQGPETARTDALPLRDKHHPPISHHPPENRVTHPNSRHPPELASSNQICVTHPDLRYNLTLQYRECTASPGKQAHGSRCTSSDGGSDHSHFNENCWDSRLAAFISPRSFVWFHQACLDQICLHQICLREACLHQFCLHYPSSPYPCSPYPCSNQHLLTHPS